MTDANEMYDAIMRELNDLVVSDSDEIKEERERLTFHEEADFDGIPPSLLSYFETSKSRAAVCEKLILEDFTASHHTEDTTNSPSELDKDVMNEQVIRDPENEENNTSSDTRLLPAPTESEALFTHNVSVCPNNEDEAGTNKYMEGEMRTLEISLNVEERKKFEAEREERHCEEMKKEEQKRRIERDFQEELRKIMEAEKLHQKELELMEKRAQEKLEQEFLLQQELIINLQRRVEEERRMREKEQKRMKDEEDKRKKEEEKMKMEAERKRMDEERRRKEEEEEERKIEEMKLKREKERKIEEEEKRRMDEKRKKEEERNKRRKLEDEMRRKKEEVERMKKEEEDERKREEERKKKEEARKEVNKMEREKRKMEELMSLKKEEEERKKREEENMRIKEEGRVTQEIEERKKQEERRKREEERKKIEARKEVEKMEREKRNMEEEMSLKKEEEERKKREEENMRIEEEGRVTKQIEERKKQEERRKKKEVEEADDRTKMVQEKMHEEMRKGDQREHGNVDEEIKLEERKMKEEKERKKREEEEEKEEARKREEERRKIDEGKETVGKQEGERPIEKDETRKKEDEMKAKEEERRRRLMEEMRRQRDEDAYVKSEEELRLRDEKREENEQEEEEERKNVDTEEEQNTEEVGEIMKEVNKRREGEMRLKEKRTFQDKEREERVMRTKEVQERRDSMMCQNENMVKTENSSRPGPFHSESTLSPTSTAATPRQHDPEETISQTFTDKTAGCENQAATPPSMSVSLPVCLPEHTEQKRLSWMKDCIPWSKLSLQNGRKQNRSLRSRRGPRRSPEAGSLPSLCPDALLRATGWRSLREVTTVTLEDLPGCSLSTLAQCTQLRSLSLRRCGLKSLEGFNQLPKLCYIDAQENNISCVDCENMTSLRVLLLGHNKLTSIHGLAGAENLDVLDLSHNSITRIAGLESVRRLQRLSVDHNQLISTKGLRDVYTLLHLNCSHNHLASVEGLENSALLNTLDLRANSLTEPPSLNNQVLLGELRLDDNSISSLQGLAACWLPLLQNLSVAQNRITQLPSMSDFVSLANLDLRFNCMSELQNVCESLEGCRFLREVHLTGNPLQQESDWRSTLQKAVPGLRAVDDRETHSSLSPPAVPQVSLAPGSFLTFCQAQLRQTRDLQQHHSRELNEASSSLDAVKTSCRQLAEALQLATDQRFAHEYGDTTVADKHRTAHQTIPEETLDVDGTNAGKSTGKVPTPNGGNIRGSSWTFEDDSGAESRHDSFNTAATGPKTGPTAGKANPGSVHSWATNGKTVFSKLEMASVSNHPDLDLQNTAAVVIQQLWRKYTQKCGNISSPSTAEVGGGRGGDGGMPESGTSYINGSVVGQDHAATVIQAFWRGFALRRRLTSALAAVTCPDAGEDDTFEEVDVDEFVFDEAALEKHWTLPLSEGPPPRRYPVSGPPLSLKPPGPLPEPSQCILPPPLVRRSKQAWVAGEQVDSAGQRVSPVSSDRSKSPASTSVASGLSERSEKIVEEWGFTNSSTALLMLKRAQKMKSKKQKKCRDPSVRLALFRNCSYQPGPVEARSRQTQHNRNNIKVPEAEPGLQRAEKTERAKQERAQQWLHTQAAHSDRDSGSVHFLPEISSDILNGGRVQLVADPGYTSHHASGLWASSSLAAQPRNENNYPRRNSLGHATEDVPSPKRITSAPSKKERISFRDNPVQLSGGWGGGKKRNKVYK